ncbi:MAG: PRC-barrel domain-containing protein [Candidatus Aenigmarchaeota archaeon]|nr:PRC-barrel domain-containing protein [Candidatus Aenigmarchaeota archaeon]
MAASMCNFSETAGKDVFTDKGAYYGRVSDIGLDLDRFKVKSLIVDAVRGSHLASLVGDKRGVVVPYSIVKSVGDIILIKHVTPVSAEPEPVEEQIKA